MIDQALDLGTYLISFDGGEPMMRKDLPQMVAHVDKERARDLQTLEGVLTGCKPGLQKR